MMTNDTRKIVSYTLRPLLFSVALLSSVGSLCHCARWQDNSFSTTNGAVQSHPIGGDATNAYGVVSKHLVNVPPMVAEDAPLDYKIGSHDILVVTVMTPGMGTEPSLGTQQNGSRVDGEGFIQLPLLGPVKISGLNRREAREHILSQYESKASLKNPDVVVEIVGYQSKALYLIGQFNKPGPLYMDRPTTLLQAISMGGSETAAADLRQAHVLRNNKVLPIDLKKLINGEDFSQNIWLQADDAIVIPDQREQIVFMLGGLRQPGPVPMIEGKLNILQALSATAGMRGKLSSEWEKVRVIRTHSPTRGEFLVINVKAMLNGDALPFELQAGDIVYLPQSPIGDWNEAINEILPTLSLFSQSLQPFLLIDSIDQRFND